MIYFRVNFKVSQQVSSSRLITARTSHVTEFPVRAARWEDFMLTPSHHLLSRLLLVVALAVAFVHASSTARSSFMVACLVSINKATPADLALEPALWAAGFGTVNVKDEDMTLAMCENTCDALIFSPADATGGKAFAMCSKPMLSSEEGFWRESSMCAPGFFKGAGCCIPQAELAVEEGTSSPLAAGFSSGNVSLFSEPRDMSWALRSGLGPDAKIAMSFASNQGYVTVFHYCKGGLMHGGVAAPGLRIALPPHYGPEEKPLAWNDAGKVVLTAALSMLAQEAAGKAVTGC